MLSLNPRNLCLVVQACNTRSLGAEVEGSKVQSFELAFSWATINFDRFLLRLINLKGCNTHSRALNSIICKTSSSISRIHKHKRKLSQGFGLCCTSPDESRCCFRHLCTGGIWELEDSIQVNYVFLQQILTEKDISQE